MACWGLLGGQPLYFLTLVVFTCRSAWYLLIMLSVFYALKKNQSCHVLPLLKPFQRLPSQSEWKAIKAPVICSFHPPLFSLPLVQLHWPPAMLLPRDLCPCCSLCLDLSPSDIFMALSADLLQIFTNNVSSLEGTSLACSPHSAHTPFLSPLALVTT